MRFRDVLSLAAIATLGLMRPLAAQDSAQAAAQQDQLRQMVEQIARDRPPQAELAAREMLRRLQIAAASVDSLRQKSLAEYWAEVAQLTVQREMLAHQQDSLRRTMMEQLFSAEARARALQRSYRETLESDSVQTRAIRAQLQQILDRHFAAEDSLRTLEIQDVERRLVQVRAETLRRRRERERLVQQMVEQVLKDARRAP